MRGDKLKKDFTLRTTGTRYSILYFEGILPDTLIEHGSRAVATEVAMREADLYKPVRRALKLQLVQNNIGSSV